MKPRQSQLRTHLAIMQYNKKQYITIIQYNKSNNTIQQKAHNNLLTARSTMYNVLNMIFTIQKLHKITMQVFLLVLYETNVAYGPKVRDNEIIFLGRPFGLNLLITAE